MKNVMHTPSEEWNSRTEKLISWKRLPYRRLKTTSWPMNICQQSLPILKPMNILLGLWLGCPFFALLDCVYRQTAPNPQRTLLQLATACISQISIPLRLPNKLNFCSFAFASVCLFI